MFFNNNESNLAAAVCFKSLLLSLAILSYKPLGICNVSTIKQLVCLKYILSKRFRLSR